jgi:hypothetical protein
MSVYKAIVAVQSALAKEGIAKDRTCTQGASYKFRGIDDIYNALAPFLAENSLCILPRMIARECVERVSKQGGALFYTTVEAEFDFVSAEDGSMHTVKTFGEAMDSGDKGTNKAMSAAYKYAAFQAFCIPTEGDNDTENHTHEVQPRQGVNKPVTHTELTEDQKKYFPRIKAALDTLYGDNTEQKKTLIKRLTAFTNKEGKEIPGIEDYRKKDGKGLQILCNQIEKLAADAKKELPQFCTECRTDPCSCDEDLS